jgi:hypothetical protein
MACTNNGADHEWVASTSMTVCGHTFTPSVGPANIPYPSGPIVPALSFPGLAEVGPNSGYSCYPFSAVYHIDDGAGNAVTITATG